MEKQSNLSFEEIMKQNERRVHYHIHRLNLQDPQQEFYQEGLVAMWNAYEKYQPDKGTLATYFNYTIRHRLIDLVRKKAKEQQHDERFIEDEKLKIDNGNSSRKDKLPLVDFSDITVEDATIWNQVQAVLTPNQWTWVSCFIISEISTKEIAVQENVSVDAVKSWGRQARKKLRNEGFGEKLRKWVEI